MLPEIPPYELKREVGQGGTATVYLARQPSLSRMVALKVLPSYFAQDEDLVARFKREATAVARLRHSHIVQVYDFGRSKDWFYLAIEFIEGGSLQQRLTAEGRLGVDEAVKLVGQIARGLQHAHERNIVHRDIKPGNIMLTTEGDAVITDFGIVKMLEGSDMTRSAGAGIGTAEYMSPEQSEGKKVGPGSDLYSLGVVFYELLTGRLPFSGDNPMVTMHRHVYEEPVSPAVVSPGLSADLAHMILKLLAKDPAERFTTARELADSLAGLPARSLGDGEGAGPEISVAPVEEGGRTTLDTSSSPTLIRHDTRLIGRSPEHRSFDPSEGGKNDGIDRSTQGGRAAAASFLSRHLAIFSPALVATAIAVMVVVGLTSFAIGRTLFFSEDGRARASQAKSPSSNETQKIAAAGGADERAPVVAAAVKTPREFEGATADTSAPSVPVLTELLIEPEAFTLTVGQTARLRAIGTYSDDTSGLPEVGWSVSDETLAQIGPSGLLTALSAGPLEVRAATSDDGTRTIVAGAAVELVDPVSPEPRKRRYLPTPKTSPTAPAGESPSEPEITLTVN